MMYYFLTYSILLRDIFGHSQAVLVIELLGIQLQAEQSKLVVPDD